MSEKVTYPLTLDMAIALLERKFHPPAGYSHENNAWTVLKEELRDARMLADERLEQITKLQQSANARLDEYRALEALANRYADHVWDCSANIGGSTCDCGFDECRAAAGLR